LIHVKRPQGRRRRTFVAARQKADLLHCGMKRSPILQHHRICTRICAADRFIHLSLQDE